MTNTHRKTTNRTTAKIAAVGAFGIGAAIAFPGLAAAQDAGTPTDPTASLAEATGEDGSLEGALGTDLGIDLGSLSFNLNLDAEAPNPGSVEFGSLGVSPNTGSEAIDGGGPAADSDSLGSGEGEADDDATEEAGGSLDLGSLGSSEEPADDTETGAATGEAASGSLGSGDEATDDAAADDETETGSLSGSLAGLSSGAEDDAADETVEAGVNADVGIAAGSLG